MRKYVEPEMKVMAINLKENIAASYDGTVSIKVNGQNLSYYYVGDLWKGGYIVDTVFAKYNNGGKLKYDQLLPENCQN